MENLGNFGSWSILTTNFLVILYLGLNGVTLCSILHLANAQWRFQIRHMACALAILWPIAFILLLILLFNGDSTFWWLTHKPEHELFLTHAEDIGSTPGYLNFTFLATREILGFLAVTTLYFLFIKFQYQTEIDSSYKAQRRFRNIALLIPFAYFIYGSMVAWDFEMTMYPEWHSATYAPYHFVSNFHMFLAFFVIFLFVLDRSGKLTKPFEPRIFNYLAQLMLAFTILYTYLYFTQYAIYWYERFPTDMNRYRNMMYEGLSTVWWTFLVFKFIVPFLTLVLTPNRHNPRVIVAVACFIVVGTWLERYTWIAGSVPPKYYHLPMTSAFDIIVTIVCFGAAGGAIWWSLNNYRFTTFPLLRGGKARPAVKGGEAATKSEG
ncbi:MAG TPA: hypothetical protein VKA13_08560 [Gammaproteobacteria bacterium]|nr:hypothetical protein [Gammaproteobacteria bacterium]